MRAKFLVETLKGSNSLGALGMDELRSNGCSRNSLRVCDWMPRAPGTVQLGLLEHGIESLDSI
jgi:hypothetical protein